MILASMLAVVNSGPVAAAEITSLEAVDIGVSSATLRWQTDSPSTSTVVYGPTSAFGQAIVLAEPATTHSAALTGLDCDADYHYAVISTDADLVVTTSDEQILRTAPCEASVPSIRVVANTTSADISWESTQPGRSHVIYRLVPNDDDPATAPDVLVDGPDLAIGNHSLTLTDLLCDSTYEVEGSTTLVDGTVESTNTVQFATYPCDPFIENVAVDAGPTTATITWTTDEQATGSVLVGTSTSYGFELDAVVTSNVHRVDMADLTCSTTYHYRVVSTDSAGETWWTPNATFVTGSCSSPIPGVPGDGNNAPSAPVISNLTTDAGETSIAIAWTTNEVSSATATWGLGIAFGNTLTSDRVGVSHLIVVTNLACGRDYVIAASSTDASGLVGYSASQPVRTLDCGAGIEAGPADPPVVVPPVDPGDGEAAPLEIADVVVRDLTKTSATVLWSTNVAATGSVAYGVETRDGNATGTIAGVTQRVVLTGLTCSTTYLFDPMAVSLDGATVVTAGTGSFTTLPCNAAAISDIAVAASQR